jgi:hypothetical protein
LVVSFVCPLTGNLHGVNLGRLWIGSGHHKATMNRVVSCNFLSVSSISPTLMFARLPVLGHESKLMSTPMTGLRKIDNKPVTGNSGSNRPVSELIANADSP